MKKNVCNPFLSLFFFFLAISIFAQPATNESNSLKLKEIQERNRVLQVQKTSDSLNEIMKKQSPDLDSASDENPEAAAFNERYEGMANEDLNQDMSKYPKAEDLDEINKSPLAKSVDAIPPVILFAIIGFLFS